MGACARGGGGRRPERAALHRLGRRDVRWYLTLGVVTTALTLPFLLVFLHAPSASIGLVAYFPALILWAMYLGPVIAISHRLVMDWIEKGPI